MFYSSFFFIFWFSLSSFFLAVYLLKSVLARVCVSSLCVWSAYGKKAFGIEHPFSIFYFFLFLAFFFELVRERVSFNIFLHVPALDATSKELPNIAKKTAKKESK